MKENQKIKLGISIGDINGIGCEVALKTFEDPRMLDFCTPVFFASNKTISQQIKDLGLNIKFNGVRDADHALEGKINIVNVWKEMPNIAYGEATKQGGDYAIRSLRAAVAALKEDKIDVLVTAPINKNNIQSRHGREFGKSNSNSLANPENRISA